MRKMRWIVNLWPGLPLLGTYGSWSGLGLALLAALALDALLLVTFGWSELIGQGFRTTLWVALGVFWVAAIVWSLGECRRCNKDIAGSQQDVFAVAVEHYLKGDYYQAQKVLEGLLRHNLRDLEARLMLATLFRHAGRFDEALRQIETLARFDGANRWELEMQRERELLAEAKMRKATAA
jgi:hypothetical protein